MLNNHFLNVKVLNLFASKIKYIYLCDVKLKLTFALCFMRHRFWRKYLNAEADRIVLVGARYCKGTPTGRHTK